MDLSKNEAFHKKALYPTVRVRTDKAGGSGLVIHSSERNGTFVLTCHHVVDDAIEVKEQWSNLLQRNVKRDVLSPVNVEFFKYAYQDRVCGSESVRAHIIAYDGEEDIALLRLEDPAPREYVATMFGTSGEDDDPAISEKIGIGAQVVTVGAALGHDPFPTIGNISCFRDIISNRVYWLISTPIIFGNSGGATFLYPEWEFVGMPARVAVSGGFFSQDVITHMGFIVPVTRVVRMLKNNMMDFLFDDSVDYATCKRKIEEKRKKTELELLLEKKEENNG